MGTFVAYNIAVAAVLVAMYIGYKYFMSGEKLIAFNRTFILAATAVCFVLPAAVAMAMDLVPTASSNAGELGVFDAGYATGVATQQVSAPVWPLVVVGIYYMGVAIAVILTAVDYMRLHRLISGGEHVDAGDGRSVVVLADSPTAPLSWHRYIVMHRADYDADHGMIVTHELAHIRRKHSVDMTLMQLVCIVQWFNPAAWLLRDELKNVHEYQADSDVLSANADARQYQMLLIKKAVGNSFPSLANSLNHSNLKKRITMMQKSNSKPVRKVRSAALLPAMLVAACAVCHPAVASRLDSMSASMTLTSETPRKVTTKTAQKQATAKRSDDAKDVLGTVEVKPQFPGGDAAMYNYLSANMKYPEAAVKAGKQGRVVVTFKVDTDGSIKDAKVLRGVDPALDAEALRLINGMPAWTPGYSNGKPVSVSYTLPVTFKMKAGSTSEAPDKVAPKKQAPTQPANNSTSAAAEVEVRPEFPDGDAGMFDYLSANMKYPESAVKAGKQGRVIVKFTIDTDGSVKDATVLRGVDPDLDAEALRLINGMPAWTPGYSNGKPVKVGYTLPVMFKMK